MWPTIVNDVIIDCRRDKWKYTYHHEPFREEALRRDFPLLPADYEGRCSHKVGIENGNKFH